MPMEKSLLMIVQAGPLLHVSASGRTLDGRRRWISRNLPSNWNWHQLYMIVARVPIGGVENKDYDSMYT